MRRQSVHAPSGWPRHAPGKRWADGLEDRGDLETRRRHQLRWDGLVTSAEHHHGIHRLGADELLGLHRQEVAIEHGGRADEQLTEAHGRKDERHAARLEHTTLDGIDEPRHQRVAGVVVRGQIGDTDQRTRQIVRVVAGAGQDSAADVARETGVAVAEVFRV
jgi:hypothetical protein